MERHSKYALRVRSAVRQSPECERQELLAFRERLYGVSDPDHVAWMYDRAPSVAQQGPSLWTWRSGDNIEAHQGAIRTTLSIDGSARELSWAIDLAVSSAYRVRGVGAILPGIVKEQAEIVAGTEVSEAAQKAFTRAGWTHLGTVPFWVRPLDSYQLLRTRGRAASKLIGKAMDGALTVLQRASGLRRRQYRLVTGERFDDRADHIWETCSPEWPVIARRDSEWLSWRWDDNPDVETTLVWLEKRGEAIGWAVLADRDHNGLRGGFILDMLCPRADMHALIALAIDQLDDFGCEAVYCMFRAPDTSRTFRAAGFIQRDTQMAMMVDAQQLPPDENVSVTDPDRWYLTSGDSDLDRVRVPFVEDQR